MAVLGVVFYLPSLNLPLLILDCPLDVNLFADVIPLVMEEDSNSKADRLRRRGLFRRVIAALAVGGVGIWGYGFFREKRVLFLVKPHEKISLDSFTEFLRSLSSKEVKEINRSLGLPDSDELDVEQINLRVLELSSHTFRNWWRAAGKVVGLDSEDLDYHKKVDWACKEFKVPRGQRPTFTLERNAVEGFVARTWDDMSKKQREDFVENAEIENRLAGFSRGPAISGDEFVKFLRQGAKRQGFQFYVRMSQFIAGTGRLVGATLPFAVYTTASRTVAFLAGPWGWAISGAIFVVERSIFGYPKAKNLMPFIMALHTLKAAKLEEVNALDQVSRELQLNA